MKLFIEEKIQSASVPIRWCMEKEEMEKMEVALKGELPYIINDKEKKTFYLLLAVVPEGKGQEEEERYIIEADKMMEYIPFYSPGRYKVFAVILLKRKRDIEEKYLHVKKDKFSEDIYEYEYWNNVFKKPSDALLCCEADVVVPVEAYAKEPPKWEKKWVNWLHEGRAKDQCQYRKRRGLAYTLKPIAGLIYVALIAFQSVVLETISTIILAFLLLCGIKGLNFKTLAHPFETAGEKFKNIWQKNKGSFFNPRWKDKKGNKYSLFFLLPFTPIVPVVSFLIFSMVFSSTTIIERVKYSLELVGGASLLFVILNLLNIITIRAGLKKQKNYWEKQREEWRKEEEQKKIKVERYEKEWHKNFEPLICNGNFEAKVQALPPAKRTFYLRFNDLKTKVCKPFAK